jgi:phosphopantothenoylcysteine decarboxylase / phosphopantothenate---cysteine ligase
MNKSILIVLTGSIACSKVIHLISNLSDFGYGITVLMTDSAREFVTKSDFKGIKLKAFYDGSEMFDDEMSHINLSRDADLVIVAPVTMNFMAKIANGLADDLASTVIAACDKQIFLVPAMNVQMWENKLNLDNVAKLEKSGFRFIGPVSGDLACGEVGMGRMVEVEEVSNEIDCFFKYRNKLKEKKVLITGGGTVEKIDPIRFIGNFSSGKQAIALADEFSLAGAEVVLLLANAHSKLHRDYKIINLSSADEMLGGVKKYLPVDIAICAAAVSDYKVKNISKEKIKKKDVEELEIKLNKNPDILKYICESKNRPDFVVGFAAETESLEGNAKEKLLNKKCDIILASNVLENDVFGSDDTNLLCISKGAVEDWGRISKIDAARKLIDYISQK